MENITAITAFDVIALIVLGYSGLVGLRRGFTTELLTLAAWAGAIFFTLYGIAWGAQDYGREVITSQFLADIITVIVLFIVGLMLFRYLAAFLGDLMKGGPIGGLDRMLGTAFGLLRGALFVAAGFLLITHFMADDEEPDWIRDAQLRPLASYGADLLRVVVPGLLNREDTDAILENMRENMPEGVSVDDAITAVQDSLPDEGERQELADMLEEMVDDASADDAEEEAGDDPGTVPGDEAGSSET